MPNSFDQKSDGIPIRIFPEKGEIQRGLLFYKAEGPEVIMDSNVRLNDHERVVFSVSENSDLAKATELDSNDRIYIRPSVVTELKYSPDRISHIQMYPPSTDGWLSHVLETGNESVFVIQHIEGKQKQLLTIVDKSSKKMYYAGLVQPYESSILEMKRDWNVHDEIMYTDISQVDIFDILGQESLSWSTLSKLVQDVTIPNLSVRKTMGETLDQLVPVSFAPDIRKQIKAFLGWLENAKIPIEDPTDFAVKHRSVGAYRVLVRGHLQCMLDEVSPPSYVRILQMADKGQIDTAQRPKSEADEEDPWTLVRFKLHEMFPNWMGRVVDYAIDLQNQGQVVSKLPVSRNEAKNSRKAWSDRFAMTNHTLFMRGHVFKESIGLLPVIYVGGAHRWPHKHLAWSARLGYSTEKPKYLQVMVMPLTAFERISRIIPSVQLVNWEMSILKPSMYNKKDNEWKMKSSLILKSLYRKRTIRQLANEFGKWQGKKTIQLSRKQVKILDLISWLLYISTLESGRYSKYYGISNSDIEQELKLMQKQGIFLLQYFLIPEKLISLCIIVKGQPEKIYSLSRAFLRYTPSSQVRISNNGESCVIVSRVPQNEFRSFAFALTQEANETGLTLETFPISAYAGYRHNLYSRLLKDDGSWDDDVSGLLEQVRLPAKNFD